VIDIKVLVTHANTC